jgi:DinB family
MNANALRHFYDYHFSENRKVWDTYVSQLSHEQFTQGASYSHGSVRDQIVHLMSVDEVWFGELRGVEPSEPFPPANSDDRKAFARTGTALSKVCEIILQPCGTICCSISRSKTQKKTKTSSCGKCFSMSSIMAQIIAPNFSGYSTIWASRQRIKTTSSMSMATRSCFS